MAISKKSRIIFFALIIIALGIVSCGIRSEPQQKPYFVIQPESGMADEVVKIKVLGLEPGQEITLIASTHDGVDHKWESNATFIADNEGIIDLSMQAPITGTYTTLDPMGLFWSMLPQAHGSETQYFAALETQFSFVNLIAEIDGKEIATANIKRIIYSKDVTQSMMTENGLVGKFYVPNSAEKYPALIILGGSEGGIYSQIASLLASHGYATLALAYFGTPPLPSSLTEIPLEYFKKAIDWLKTQEEVDHGEIGVIGGSRGGELALLLGSTFPEIKVVVGYVGSGIVFCSEDSGRKAAWTYNGEPIPFLVPFSDFDEATIPVEKINGAILLISGKDDQIWPSTRLSEVAITRLEESNHSYPFEHLAYDDAGHHIGAPYFWPTSGDVLIHPISGAKYSFGGTPEGNALANADSWVKMLEFLESNLLNVDH